jgi:DNA-directed RNA polymerase specialized sigma subunit, sigma24 homolog
MDAGDLLWAKVPDADLMALKDAIAALPESDAQMLGYILEGYTLTEIAQRVSKKLGAVKSAVKRAKDKLKKEFRHDPS